MPKYDADDLWTAWCAEYMLQPVSVIDGLFTYPFDRCGNCGALFSTSTVDEYLIVERMVWEDSSNCECDDLPGKWNLDTLEAT